MENNETYENIYNEIDDSWIHEFEKTELEYSSFYKEQIDTVKINYIYVDKNNSINAVNQETIIIDNGKIEKERIFEIIKNNKKKDNIDYRLISILKYNITLDPEDIKDYINDELEDDFLQK